MNIKIAGLPTPNPLVRRVHVSSGDRFWSIPTSYYLDFLKKNVVSWSFLLKSIHWLLHSHIMGIQPTPRDPANKSNNKWFISLSSLLVDRVAESPPNTWAQQRQSWWFVVWRRAASRDLSGSWWHSVPCSWTWHHHLELLNFLRQLKKNIFHTTPPSKRFIKAVQSVQTHIGSIITILLCCVEYPKVILGIGIKKQKQYSEASSLKTLKRSHHPIGCPILSW